ncbi:MAG: prephenate dehydrogenase [Bifidobacteriaceae bacterium]|jgi:prephenate dehydrogenase|nr:prephenate dehydrogenase [Bifidobacteriaceae bacterium]
MTAPAVPDAPGAPGLSGEGPTATSGPVHVIGSGLLGASLGMALTRRGVEVTLEDISPLNVGVAADLGAGRARAQGDPEPALVVVAVPPDMAGGVVVRALRDYPGAVVTDVASVKSAVLQDVHDAGADLTRYVGSHPMAGRERSGPAAALPDLFEGRPWVIVDSGASAETALLRVRDVAVDVGAQVFHMDAASHDKAVALVSHVPQVVSSLMAGVLAEADDRALALAGGGLRDVTRIAASDPALWAVILLGNAGPVAGLLRGVRDGLDQALAALDQAAAGSLGEPMAALHRLIAAGNEGVARIPGKHGGAHVDWDEVTVMVPDEPGALGRLFTLIGDIGLNLEDVNIEHAGGKPVGLTTIYVAKGAGAEAAAALAGAGWRILA